MSNTTIGTRDIIPAVPTTCKTAQAAAKAFNEAKATANPKIPKPSDSVMTQEQIAKEKSITDCRRQILNIPFEKLKESVLGAVCNQALDDESRVTIVNEIKQGLKHLPDDYDEEDDALVIENAKDLIVKTIHKPAELIYGILYQGGKMSFNAPSKMGKTWSLLHLAISMSSGIDWFGHKTTKSKVLFINPELQNFSFEDRIQHIARNINGNVTLENLDYITTRGKKLSTNQLLPMLEKKIKPGRYAGIFLDSIYKLYPNNTDENSSSDIGKFLNELEMLTNHTGSSIIYSHHYSKGNQSQKAAIDRSSGAGAWGRDPDTIVSVTEHEKENSYTVEFNLRDFKPVEPFTITVNWPNVIRNTSLNPKALKTTQYAAKYSNNDIIQILAKGTYTTTGLQKELKNELGMSSGTFYAMWPDVQKVEGVVLNDKRWTYEAQANVANN
jgi:hypothetical protein